MRNLSIGSLDADNAFISVQQCVPETRDYGDVQPRTHSPISHYFERDRKGPGNNVFY